MTDSRKPFLNLDLSDRLALLSCYRINLSDIHPTGEWMLHALYQAYITQPYGGLTIGQMDQLLSYLKSEVDSLTAEDFRHWLTTRNQQLALDSTHASPQNHQSTEGPMASVHSL